MGKNSDLKNIFESYYNDVVLREADDETTRRITTLETLVKVPQSEEAKAKLQQELDDLKKQQAPENSGGNITPLRDTIKPPTAPQTTIPSTNQPVQNLEAEYNKKLGRTPGAFDADNFNNIDRVGNDKRFPEMAAYKKQLQSGQVPSQTANAAPPAQQSTTSNGGMQLGGGISIGSPTGTGTTQQPIPSFSGVDVTIPQDLQLPQQPTPTPTKTTPSSTQSPKPQAKQTPTSSGSIVDYLASKGQATDRTSRAKLAAQYGIQNYSGTADQNTQLLSKLKSGENPTQAAAQTTTTQQTKKGTGGIVGGASKAIGSVGQGIKQATIGTKKPLGGILGGISKAAGSVGKGIKTALVGNQEEEEGKQYNESFGIAKFLKCVSEKNYHQANVYLNKIIQNKVKEKISSSIK